MGFLLPWTPSLIGLSSNLPRELLLLSGPFLVPPISPETRERDHSSTGLLCTAVQAVPCTRALSRGAHGELKSNLRFCLLRCLLWCPADSPEEEVPLSDVPKAMSGLAVTMDGYVTPPCRRTWDLLCFPEESEPGRKPSARLETFPRLSSSSTRQLRVGFSS